MIGKKSVHCYQNKMCEKFLFHSALGFGVEILYYKYLFADLVQFLDTPPRMINIHEVLDWIELLFLDQRCSQTIRCRANLIFDESYSQWNNVEIRVFLPDFSLSS